MSVKSLSSGAFRVDVAYPGPAHTCGYLLVQDGFAALVDCGAKEGSAAVLSALSTCGLKPEAVEWLIVTHAHLDHAGSAGQLMRELPNAIFAGHPSAVKHLVDPDAALAPAARRLYGGSFFDQYYGELLPIATDRTRTLEDGEEILLGGRRPLCALHTPGHAWHHLSIYDPSESLLCAGDAFGVSYSDIRQGEDILIVPVMPPNQFNPEAMAESLRRIRNSGAKWAGLAHFDVVPVNDATTDMQLAALDEWLAVAEKKYAESPEDFTKTMTDFIMNWIGELAGRLGLDLRKVAERHKMDTFLSVRGFEYLLKKRAAESEAAQ